MSVFTGFIGPSNVLDSLDSDVQRTVNLFPERNETGTGKSPWRLRGRPGLSTLQTLTPLGPVLGMVFTATRTQRILAVCADKDTGDPVKLLEVSVLGVETDRGTLNATTATNTDPPASMCYNVNGSGEVEVLIVLPGYSKAFIFNTTSNVLTDITATIDGTATPIWGVQLDGFFIVLTNDGKFRLSNINDGLTWDALDVGESTVSPDVTQSILAHSRELWIFGNNSISIWFNSGNADFPFEPIQGADIQIGISATYSVQVVGEKIMWVGRSPGGYNMVWMASGLQPVRISTRAVENALQDIPGPGNTLIPVRSWTYQMGGHYFYVLSFPDNNATWVYDLTSGLWHEEMYLNGSTEEAHRGACHIFIDGIGGTASTGGAQGGEHWVGDRANGKIYQMRDTFFDDAGDKIRRIRTAPHLHSENKTHFYSRLELDAETGSDSATTLSGDHTDSITTITVVSTTGFLSAGTIWIEDEAISYTGTTATTFTGCTRGAHGTLAASHSTTVAVDAASEFNLEISKDGGHTYASPLVATAGAQNDFDARIAWRRLGSARDKVFRVSSDAPIRHSWNEAYLDATLGDH